MVRLINGNYKTIDMGIPIAKVEDNKVYIDTRLDETRSLEINYGEVRNLSIGDGQFLFLTELT